MSRMLGEYFEGSVLLLENLVLALKEQGLRVLSYKLEGDLPVIGEVSRLSDLLIDYTDIQSPGSYRLAKEVKGVFRHTQYSPKHLLHYPTQVIYEISDDFEIIRTKDDFPPSVLFGIKPCDLAAIEVLDKVLERDDVYQARRARIEYIVVEECVEPGGTCFCGSIGTGPAVAKGYDIAYARLGDQVLFKVGSEKGLKLVEKVGLTPASDETLRRYNEALNEARRKASRIPPFNVVVRALEDVAAAEGFWREASARCVGCTNCNMVCPTCFCTEFSDYADLSGKAWRERHWFGCLSFTYGQVAGQHFRPELFMRYRHFVLHKFLFYQRQVGLPGCVGCGRCITWCPMGIDLREVVSRAVGYVGR
ncbi:MAG: 4Fe-4S dicluster domain-containing protein [Sulfolobales archaeon]